MINKIAISLIGSNSYKKGVHNVFDRLGFLLNIMVFFISGSYFVYDFLNGFYTPLLPLGIINIGSISGFILARFGKISLSKIVVIIMSNIALFLITCADDYATGSHLYYITLCLASFTVLGLRYFQISIYLTVLSFVLYQISALTDFSLLSKFIFTPEEVKARFVFNSTMFIIMSMGVFILYLRLMSQQHAVIKSKNDELKRTNSELDHFLYSTSHDLRAPLASVQGLLSIAAETKDPKELARIHGLMNQQVHKMDDFIKDIINIMRNSRQPVNKEVFNLHNFFDDILAENKYNYHSGDVKISNEISENIDLNTDRTRLKTVVGNLCSNALKYADMEKHERYVRVNCEMCDDNVVLNISDNGIGIDPTYSVKVFDMFYRATEKSQGSGLGLYIAKETVNNLGGEISLDSTLGKGTKFSVSLPKDVLVS
ncbi:MAG: HAMP domain-containing sensor histidine kinase [Bacteroidota bacterium]